MPDDLVMPETVDLSPPPSLPVTEWARQKGIPRALLKAMAAGARWEIRPEYEATAVTEHAFDARLRALDERI